MRIEQETTEIIQDERRVLQAVLSFFARARSRLDLSVSFVAPRAGDEVASAITEARRRGVRVRMVTEVSNENLGLMKAGARLMEIRHIEGLRGNSWGVTEGEYVSSMAAGEFRTGSPIIYSNAKPLVAEHQSIFDALWDRGEPLEERVEAVESGTNLPEMEIIRDPAKTKQLYLSLARQAKKEALVVFPTVQAFRRDDQIGVIRLLEERASKGVQVKLLLPVDAQVLARLTRRSGRSLLYRALLTAEAQETVTYLVIDRTASLTIDERDPSQERFEDAFGSAILATREPRVRQSVRMFDRTWREAELAGAERAAKESEEASRKRAELMQDILTHDIRNFNQVAMLNAELLGERLDDRESTERLAAILRAVEGSTKLIERAKKLGAIMAAKAIDLRPTDLRKSFERAVQLVRKGNPDVALTVSGRLGGRVLADEFLDEVFINLVSNSVKYTDGRSVSIILGQRKGELLRRPGEARLPCWEVTISDKGRGIPDSQKGGLFRRYLETAKGSGLGLSIVYALVAERYGGRVSLKDRVRGDHAKGTTVEILLPKA